MLTQNKLTDGGQLAGQTTPTTNTSCHTYTVDSGATTVQYVHHRHLSTVTHSNVTFSCVISL